MHRHHPTPVDALYPIGVTIVTDWSAYTAPNPITASGVVTSPEHCTSLDYETPWYALLHPTLTGDAWEEVVNSVYDTGFAYLTITAHYDDGRSAIGYLPAPGYITIYPPA